MNQDDNEEVQINGMNIRSPMEIKWHDDVIDWVIKLGGLDKPSNIKPEILAFGYYARIPAQDMALLIQRYDEAINEKIESLKARFTPIELIEAYLKEKGGTLIDKNLKD